MSTTKDSSIVFPFASQARTYRKDVAPGEATLFGTGTTGNYSVVRTRIGSSMPHWREKVNSGQNATTGMTAVYCTVDYSRTHPTRDFCQWVANNNPTAIFRRENKGDTFIMNDQNSISLASSLFTSKVSTSFVDNLARAAFYKKLRAIDTQFEGYIFAGELMETLHMLRRPLVGIRSLSKDFLDTLRKRKRANPKKWLNDIGSAWLEQSFGWNPLLNDVKDAYKAYSRVVKPVKTFQISASAKKWYDVTKSNSTNHWPGYEAYYNGGNYYHTMSSGIIERHTIRYKGALVKRTNAPHWQNQDLFGFEPQNFIPAAWELLPWSFLADYFTNIGDILNSAITSDRDLAWVNRSEIVEVVKNGQFVLIPKSPVAGDAGWTKQGFGGGRNFHRASRKAVSRSAGVVLSLPTLQFNFDLTGGQLANIDALLSQASALHPQHNPRNWHR